MKPEAAAAVGALGAALALATACRGPGGAGSEGRVSRAQAERLAVSRTGGLVVLSTSSEREGRAWMVEVLTQKRGTRAEVEVDSATGRVLSIATRDPPVTDDPIESTTDRQRPNAR